MRKSILLCVFLVLATTCEAKIYVCLDKNTDNPIGVTDIDPNYKSDWESRFNLIEATEDFRGKHGYEIKIEDGKPRKATKEEIDASKPVLKTEKERILETLSITQEDIDKLKAK